MQSPQALFPSTGGQATIITAIIEFNQKRLSQFALRRDALDGMRSLHVAYKLYTRNSHQINGGWRMTSVSMLTTILLAITHNNAQQFLLIFFNYCG